MGGAEVTDKLSPRLFPLDPNIRYVIVRYGMQYQLLFPYKEGHVSIGVELKADVDSVAQAVAQALSLPL